MSIERDDIVVINGRPFVVTGVRSATSLDLKPLGWWKVLLWRIRRCWAWVKSRRAPTRRRND